MIITFGSERPLISFEYSRVMSFSPDVNQPTAGLSIGSMIANLERKIERGHLVNDIGFISLFSCSAQLIGLFYIDHIHFFL
jgi:hypothetical protein